MYGTFYSIEKVTKDAAPKILFKKPPTIFEKQQLPKFRQCDFLQCRKSERINGLRRMYLLANALLIFPIPFSVLFFFLRPPSGQCPARSESVWVPRESLGSYVIPWMRVAHTELMNFS